MQPHHQSQIDRAIVNATQVVTNRQQQRRCIGIPIEKPKVRKARDLMVVAHAGQKRKYCGSPYETHPAEVAQILIQHKITDERSLVAALLHDVVEDTPVTIWQIERDFGEQTKLDVQALTKPKHTGSRKATLITATANQIARGPVAVAVKIADIIANITDVALHDSQFAELYLAEKKEALDQFRNSSLGRNAQVRALLTTAYEIHAESLNQLALTVLAHENERVLDEAASAAEIEAILSRQSMDEVAELGMF